MTPQLVAQELGLRYRAYQCSKLSFEDLAGFPMPETGPDGTPHVRYYPSASSLWCQDLVLLDEIGRASPAVQGKLLEVILDKRCMGEPTSLQHVWAAANPAGQQYHSEQLDEALLSRFTFLIEPPHINSLGDDAIGRIIPSWFARTGLSVPDAAAQTTGSWLTRLLAEAGRHTANVFREEGEKLATYLRYLYRALSARYPGDIVRLDARTFTMLHEALVAYRAACLASGEAVPLAAAGPRIRELLGQAFPLLRLTQEGLVPITLFDVHQVAWAAAGFAGRTESTTAVRTLCVQAAPLDAVVDLLLTSEVLLDQEDAGKFIVRLTDALAARDANPEEQAHALYLLWRILSGMPGVGWPGILVSGLESLERRFFGFRFAHAFAIGKEMDISLEAINADPILLLSLCFKAGQWIPPDHSAPWRAYVETMREVKAEPERHRTELTRIVSSMRAAFGAPETREGT